MGEKNKNKGSQEKGGQEKNNQGSSTLKPDTVMKSYLRSNEKFADLVNGMCFHGEKVVLPEELTDEDTDESYLTDMGGDKTGWQGDQKIHAVQLTRDSIRAQITGGGNFEEDRMSDGESAVNAYVVCKTVRNLGIQVVLWAMEPQIYVDYSMALRIMGCDYGTYKKQYDRNAEKFTEEWMEENHIVGNERLSRMRKTDKFFPVITICLYLGESEWDGARSLKEMLVIPEKVSGLVNDYPIHLIDARRDAPKLVFHDERNQDLFALLALISDKRMPIAERRKKVKRYSEEHRVASEVIRAVSSITRRKVQYVEPEEEEVTSMDELMQYILDEGKAEGKAEGEKDGQMAVIQWMIDNPGSTPMQAMEAFGLS